jgi:hypothetical protein
MHQLCVLQHQTTGLTDPRRVVWQSSKSLLARSFGSANLRVEEGWTRRPLSVDSGPVAKQVAEMAERVCSCRDRPTGYDSMYSVADLTRRILLLICERPNV